MRLAAIILLVATAPLVRAAPIVIEMQKGNLTADGVILPAGKEREDDNSTLRLRNSTVGRVFLVKAKKPGEYRIFGRKVSLEKDGQYLVKGTTEKKVDTAIALGKTAVKEWAPDAETTAFFTSVPVPPRLLETIKKESASPSPGPSAQLLTPTIKESLPTILRSAVAKDRDQLFTAPPRLSASEELLAPTRSRPTAETPPPRPRAGAEANVYTVESGLAPGYAVQPGDTLDIVFYRVQRATVDMKGDIRVVSSVGNAEAIIQTAGKTPEEIAKQVAESGLNFNTLVNPAIKVTISQFAESNAIVLGNVKNPGRVNIDPETTTGVYDLLEKSGGLEKPGQPVVVFIRRGEKIIKVDTEKNKKAAVDRIEIHPGDIVTVTQK